MRPTSSETNTSRSGLRVLYSFAWRCYLDGTAVVRKADKTRAPKHFFRYSEENWQQVLQQALASPIVPENLKLLLPQQFSIRALEAYRRTGDWRDFEQTLGPEYVAQMEKNRPSKDRAKVPPDTAPDKENRILADSPIPISGSNAIKKEKDPYPQVLVEQGNRNLKIKVKLGSDGIQSNASSPDSAAVKKKVVFRGEGQGGGARLVLSGPSTGGVKELNDSFSSLALMTSRNASPEVECVEVKPAPPQYMLDEVLEVGGQGIAIKAHVNNFEQRKVVVKIPYGSTRKRVLMTETMVSTRVHSRYVLKVLDTTRVLTNDILGLKNAAKARKYVTPDEEVCGLVYEFMSFRSLNDWLGAEGDKATAPLPVWNIHIIALEQAIALNACHESRILHRDFKTDNVFVRDDMILDRHADPKLLYKRFLTGLAYTALGDPGLATAIRGRMTKQVGTSGQIAPEMYSETAYGPSVDVFAFCVTLIELYTGASVYPLDLQDDEVDEMVQAGDTTTRCAALLRKHKTGLDEGTQAILFRGLNMNPQLRPKMQDFIVFFRERLDFVRSALQWKW